MNVTKANGWLLSGIAALLMVSALSGPAIAGEISDRLKWIEARDGADSLRWCLVGYGRDGREEVRYKGRPGHVQWDRFSGSPVNRRNWNGTWFTADDYHFDMLDLEHGKYVMRVGPSSQPDAPKGSLTIDQEGNVGGDAPALKEPPTVVEKWREGQSNLSSIMAPFKVEVAVNSGKFPAELKVGPIPYAFLTLEASDYDSEWFAASDYRVKSMDPDTGTWVLSVKSSRPNGPPGEFTLDSKGIAGGSGDQVWQDAMKPLRDARERYVRWLEADFAVRLISARLLAHRNDYDGAAGALKWSALGLDAACFDGRWFAAADYRLQRFDKVKGTFAIRVGPSSRTGGPTGFLELDEKGETDATTAPMPTTASLHTQLTAGASIFDVLTRVNVKLREIRTAGAGSLAKGYSGETGAIVWSDLGLQPDKDFAGHPFDLDLYKVLAIDREKGTWTLRFAYKGLHLDLDHEGNVAFARD
ncbi:MAG: hypothetical protein AB7K09_09550 [Planctomycetota bacterium]